MDRRPPPPPPSGPPPAWKNSGNSGREGGYSQHGSSNYYNGPSRPRPLPPRQPPPSHSIESDQGDRFSSNRSSSNYDYRRNDSLGGSGRPPYFGGREGGGRYDKYDSRRNDDYGNRGESSHGPRSSSHQPDLQRSHSSGSYESAPPLNRESSIGSVRGGNSDEKDPGNFPRSSSSSYSRDRISSSQIDDRGYGNYSSSNNTNYDNNNNLNPARRSFSSGPSSSFGHPKKSGAPPPPPGPPPMRRAVSDGSGWGSNRPSSNRQDDRPYSSYQNNNNNNRGMPIGMQRSTSSSSMGRVGVSRGNNNAREEEDIEPGEVREAGEVVEEGEIVVEPTLEEGEMELNRSLKPDSITAMASSNKKVDEPTFLSKSSLSSSSGMVIAKPRSPRREVSTSESVVSTESTSRDRGAKLLSNKLSSTRSKEEQPPHEEEDEEQQPVRKRDKADEQKEKEQSQAKPSVEEEEGEEEQLQVDDDVEPQEQPVRVKGRPGRKPKRKRGPVKSAHRELVIDTSMEVEDGPTSSPRKSPKASVVVNREDEKAHPEGDTGDEASDGEGRDKRKKKPTKRLRRAKEENEGEDEEESPQQPQEQQAEEEEEEELGELDPTRGRRKDDSNTSRGEVLKKRRKSRQSSLLNNEDNAAPARAAKKRAVELIAKPKTPSSGPASGFAFEGADTDGLAGQGGAPGEQVPTKGRLAMRQTSGASHHGGAAHHPNGTKEDHPTTTTTTTSAPNKRLTQQARWEEVKKSYLVNLERLVEQNKVVKPIKLQAKAKVSILGVPIAIDSKPSAHSSIPAYADIRDAPGWKETNQWAKENWSELVECMKRRSMMEMNHARLGYEEYTHLNHAWKVLKEQQRLMAEAQAQPSKHRYPSRSNPAAIALELGHEHGAAEQARREKERRKNAAILPDMEPHAQYLASVFDRKQLLTTDGQPALCSHRPISLPDCVPPPPSPIPTLLVPSPLGCNCAKAVVASERKPWTDAEKCLFLDKFLQFPKDFQRIASFFREKTTEDMIAFYYDTKKTCDYKLFLGEHYSKRGRSREPGELLAVREAYLAKLGVKLPPQPEWDATTPASTSSLLTSGIQQDKSVGPSSTCVLVNRVDIFPRPAGTDPRLDVYPVPAIVHEVPISVDASDLQNWLVRAASS